MTDISKCDGEGCPRKDSCYRYTATSSTWQSWFSAPPGCEDGLCPDYMPNEEVPK